MNALGLLLAAMLFAGAPGSNDLHEAVKANDAERVRALLHSGADPNFRDPLGSTPLHDAAWNGYREIAELLIEYHADVNARHLEAGSTPLHYAIIKDHPEIVELLLDHGADIKATYRSGATPLHLAAGHGYRDIVALLLKHGADVQARDHAGETALDAAAEKGYAGTAVLLVDKGAPVNARNPESGATPLNAAARNGH